MTTTGDPQGATTMTTLADVLAAANAADLGTPTARKGGRNPRWPYVPVVQHHSGGVRGDGYQEQAKGLAYATRAEAVEVARLIIENRRSDLAENLATPRMRSLREHHGLPRELPADGAG